MARTVSRAMIRLPMEAWIGTSNICLGMVERNFSTIFRPWTTAASLCKIMDKASTEWWFTNISTLTSGAAW